MKKLFILILPLTVCFAAANAVTISSFGTEIEAADLVGSWIGQYTSGTSTVGGTARDFAAGIQDFTSIGSIDITGANQVSLTAHATLDPLTGFIIRLYDSGFDDTLVATFDWTDFTSGSTTITSSLFTETVVGGFDNMIGGWELATGGSFSASLAVQFTSLTASAVPEPSTYAAIAGILALGFTVIRRRRQRG